MLISSDTEEIMELSDRAVTVYQGHVNAMFMKENLNQNDLLSATLNVVGDEKVV